MSTQEEVGKRAAGGGNNRRGAWNGWIISLRKEGKILKLEECDGWIYRENCEEQIAGVLEEVSIIVD